MMLLGVRIDPVRKTELHGVLAELLADGRQHMIATPNPEMLVLAHRQPEFATLLNQSDLNVPDGIGLVFASKFLGAPLPERVTGVEVLFALAELAVRSSAVLYLLGDAPGVAERAALTLRRTLPKLRVVVDAGGVILERSPEWQEDPAIMERIRGAKPTMLGVALGHGKQEKWIRDHLAGLPSVRIAVGVGGAFHYYAGTTPRAPNRLQRMGLEWLWRLFKEPRRLRRILRAVVVFPVLVLLSNKSR